ncbi:MAG: phosphatidylserine decarboxylase [Propionibacteriaceae bacterium]|nr:phosphatidylserine decarboxylase [Propionibacteriaceae bacterium]
MTTSAQVVRDRATGEVSEDHHVGGSALVWLYTTGLGRLVANVLVTQRWFSRFLGWPMTWKSSASRIPGFISQHSVKTKDFESTDYESFADFFGRRLAEDARHFDLDPRRLVAPADSKVSVSPIGQTLTIKGFDYTLETLLGRELPTDGFTWAVIFRLSIDDYHRFHFIDDCEILDQYEIPGKLHTVGPQSDGRGVFAENHRVVTRLATQHFGEVIQVTVGALLVGRIHMEPVELAFRGQEQGHFGLGASTIVLLVNANIDSDIIADSEAGIETRIRVGESVGSAR